jgi:hypothetical protein
VVTALMALRGIDFVPATAFLAEIGDLCAAGRASSDIRATGPRAAR